MDVEELGCGLEVGQVRQASGVGSAAGDGGSSSRWGMSRTRARLCFGPLGVGGRTQRPSSRQVSVQLGREQAVHSVDVEEWMVMVSYRGSDRNTDVNCESVVIWTGLLVGSRS